MPGITIDEPFAYFGYPVYCLLCVHFQDITARRCDAFDGIPEDIWFGEVDHREAYEGDGGVRFERAPGVADEAIQNAFEGFDD